MYAIAPASDAPNRITPFFEANTKELELSCSKGDLRRREAHSIQSSHSDSNVNKLNGYFPSQSSQNSNNEIIQFMKSQIQVVREEFVGALKELITVTKLTHNSQILEGIGKDNESENCSAFYKTSGEALLNSVKLAEQNLNRDTGKATNESNIKKKKVKKESAINRASSVQQNHQTLFYNHAFSLRNGSCSNQNNQNLAGVIGAGKLQSLCPR